jgi:hypothetical protein
MGALIDALDWMMQGGHDAKQRKAIVTTLLNERGHPPFDGYIVVCSDGSIGLATIGGYSRSLYRVQYGADGPFALWAIDGMRYATREEIKAAGLDGVSAKQAPL